ncbi:prolipoprotein diacylglyceryl transferase [Candidatus Poribacteria bacterium]|nr:prolipoprotein diacylglyceryl transferase [Candidatus Poribacteria bacterium]
MSFENGVVPTPPGVRVHPTPLYEVIFCLAIFVFLWKIRKRKEHLPGFIFGAYLILAGIERFVTEFWRRTSVIVFQESQLQFINRTDDLRFILHPGLSIAQITSFAMIGVGIWMILRSKRARGQGGKGARGQLPSCHLAILPSCHLAFLTILYFIIFGMVTTELQAAFENIGIGAKPMGMGGAYTAPANDTNAIIWNPAGLADISKQEIGLSYLELYGLVGYSFIAYAHHIDNLGTIAGSLSGSNDSEGNYQEVALNISAARRIIRNIPMKSGKSSNLDASGFWPNLSIGFNLKYLKSRANMGEIKIGSGAGCALDLGLRYDLKNKLRLGIYLPNLLSYIAYNREELKNAKADRYSESLFREYHLGLAVNLDFIHGSLSRTLLSTELANGNLLFGMEKQLRNAAIRAGYRFSNGLSNGITVGLGYRVAGFELDYAYVSGKYGSQTSQFSIKLH